MTCDAAHTSCGQCWRLERETERERERDRDRETERETFRGVRLRGAAEPVTPEKRCGGRESMDGVPLIEAPSGCFMVVPVFQ